MYSGRRTNLVSVFGHKKCQTSSESAEVVAAACDGFSGTSSKRKIQHWHVTGKGRDGTGRDRMGQEMSASGVIVKGICKLTFPSSMRPASLSADHLLIAITGKGECDFLKRRPRSLKKDPVDQRIKWDTRCSREQADKDDERREVN